MSYLPKPTAIKKLTGTRKDRVAKDEPTVEVATQSGKKIRFTLAQHAEYQEYFERLTRQRILTENDVDLLAVYVKEFSMYRQYIEQVENEGGILTKGKDVKYINPAADLANRHLKNYLAVAPHFGFSPATRSKISVTAAENVNPFEKLKAG